MCHTEIFSIKWKFCTQGAAICWRQPGFKTSADIGHTCQVSQIIANITVVRNNYFSFKAKVRCESHESKGSIGRLVQRWKTKVLHLSWRFTRSCQGTRATTRYWPECCWSWFYQARTFLHFGNKLIMKCFWQVHRKTIHDKTNQVFRTTVLWTPITPPQKCHVA